MNIFKIISLLFCLTAFLAACSSENKIYNPVGASPVQSHEIHLDTVRVGAERFDAYLPLLRGKSVAVVANATSVVGETHLVDALIEKGINVAKVFAPEHGFRGKADAGAAIEDEIDPQTGVPILSLYGTQKKPSAEVLTGVDVMVFDIQDVGVRFYTYLSTLHYVIESCAENDVPLVLLDRPNPNGHYIDGPVLESAVSSFVGLHPVPLVYGMTIGEYGQMINGEGWLKGGLQCDLTVVKLEGYGHETRYALPVKPSPNLPNMTSIYLYPSLALFEGTVVSVGRGTEFPFQTVGHPDYMGGSFEFTPRPTPGAMNPKLKGQLSRGFDLRETEAPSSQISLDWMIEFYTALPDKDAFFLKNNFFNRLAGNDILMRQIKDGLTEAEIRASWQADLAAFKTVRQGYLLYE